MILTILVGAFFVAMANRPLADVTILTSGAQPYLTLDSGLISNPLRVKIVNRTVPESQRFYNPKTFARGIRGRSYAGFVQQARFGDSRGPTTPRN